MRASKFGIPVITKQAMSNSVPSVIAWGKFYAEWELYIKRQMDRQKDKLRNIGWLYGQTGNTDRDP